MGSMKIDDFKNVIDAAPDIVFLFLKIFLEKFLNGQIPVFRTDNLMGSSDGKARHHVHGTGFRPDDPADEFKNSAFPRTVLPHEGDLRPAAHGKTCLFQKRFIVDELKRHGIKTDDGFMVRHNVGYAAKIKSGQESILFG